MSKVVKHGTTCTGAVAPVPPALARFTITMGREHFFSSNICTCYNIARFLGDVSGLAEFVDDKVTVVHCYYETEMARFHHFLADHGDSIEHDNDVHGTIKNEHKDQNKDVNDDDTGDLLSARLLLGFDAAPQQVEAGGSSSSGPSDQQQQ